MTALSPLEDKTRARVISATYTPPRRVLPLLLVLAEKERKEPLRENIQRLPSASAQVLQAGRALIAGRRDWLAVPGNR